jgi:RNA recognition motif-containing protein
MNRNNSINKDHTNLQKERYTCFIGCLPGIITEKAVQDYFGQFGEIINIVLKRKKNKAGAGFGTFEVVKKEDFESINRMKHSMEGREITCRPYYKGAQK